jgi:hypothetical protein
MVFILYQLPELLTDELNCCIFLRELIIYVLWNEGMERR